MNALVTVLAAYLIGSVSFAVMMSRVFSLPDPRSYGSGNPGATNVLRTGKKLAALFTLLGDAGKGAFVVWLAQVLSDRLQLSSEVIEAVALAVFLGHLYPVYHRFQGGKGVATAAGIFIALHWPFGLALIAVWAAVLAVSRVSSLAALCGAFSAAPLAYYFFGLSTKTLLVFCIALLLIWRHRSNIMLLLAGRERRVRGSDGENTLNR